MGMCGTKAKKAPEAPEAEPHSSEPWEKAGVDRQRYEHILIEFATLDDNQDHRLSRKEFDVVSGLPEFLGMAQDDIDDLFNLVDVDHNGFISLQEFVAYMAKRKDHNPLPVQVQPQRDRLDSALQRSGFVVCTTNEGRRGVSGDGNCQFYSLSWQMKETTSQAAAVRQQVVEFMGGPARQDLSEFYAPTYSRQPSTFDAYLVEMAKDCTWGDHLTLQAAATLFNLEVRLLTPDQCNAGAGTKPYLVLSSGKQDVKIIWMSFAAQHYSPVEPTASTPDTML